MKEELSCNGSNGHTHSIERVSKIMINFVENLFYNNVTGE